MKFLIKIFMFFILLVFSDIMLAQDTLIFINGRRIPATNVKLSDSQILFNPLNKPQKLKKAEAYNIFSIKHPNGDETLIYMQDTLTDDLTIDQMRMFVKGQQDAMEYFNPTAVTVASIVVGAASGPLQIFSLAPPAVFATIVGASSPDMDRQPVPDKQLLESPEYRMGYESKARNIKIKKALIFGLSTAVASWVTFSVIERNDND